MNSSLLVETDAFVSVFFFFYLQSLWIRLVFIFSHHTIRREWWYVFMSRIFSKCRKCWTVFIMSESVRFAVNYDYTTFSDSLNFETMVPSLFTVPTFGHTHQLSEHTQKCATYRYDCMIKFSGVTLHTPETSLPFHFLCCLNQKYII